MTVHAEHVASLKEKSVFFEEENLRFTVRAPSGIGTTAGVIFLESGNDKAGWNHLVKHFMEFTEKGLKITDFQMLLENKLAMEPDSVGRTLGGDGAGTLATYVIDAGKGNFTLNIVVGSNGFVVTAHPYEMSASDYYGALKNSAKVGDSTAVSAAYIGLAGYSAHG
jgi:hypothetical protein